MSARRKFYIKKYPGASWIEHRTRMHFEQWVCKRRISHTFGDGDKRSYWIGGLLVLAAVSDGIRRLCGRREGLLTMLLAPVAAVYEYFDNMQAEFYAKLGDMLSSGAASEDNADTWIGRLRALNPTRDEKNSAKIEGTETAKEPENTWFDPSLTTEGPFWCRDLTSADKTLTLPIIFSATFLASIYYGPRLAREPLNRDPAPKSSAPVSTNVPELTPLQRFMMTVACLSSYPAAHMPSALLIYFISNIAVSAIHARLMGHFVPIRLPPIACRRPVRSTAARERSNPGSLTL